MNKNKNEQAAELIHSLFLFELSPFANEKAIGWSEEASQGRTNTYLAARMLKATLEASEEGLGRMLVEESGLKLSVDCCQRAIELYHVSRLNH